MDQLDDQGREYLSFAFDGANRMATMIRDLLAYARFGSEAIKAAATNMQGVLDHALANLKIAITQADAAITADAMPTLR